LRKEAKFFNHGVHMKLSVLVLGLAISSASFGATVLNGVTLQGLPTLSKSYSQVAVSDADAETMKARMTLFCNQDKARAQEFAVRTLGSKVIASEGCSVAISGDSYCDQGGCGSITVSTSFEIVLK
jgi:hypothetical protein